MTSRERIVYAIPPGTRLTTCKGCLKPIVFVETSKGKKMPLNMTGEPHAATCSASPEFREKKRLEARLAELKAGKT